MSSSAFIIDELTTSELTTSASSVGTFNWYTGKVTNMQSMFENYQHVQIDTWDTSKVRDMSHLFGEDIYKNPSIFTYDYGALKQRMKDTIAEDLMKNRFHPRNMDKWVGWGQVEKEDDFE